MRKIRKFWDDSTHKKSYCKSGGEYLAKPEESLTIKQIIARYLEGQPLDIMRRPCTYEDENVSDDALFDSPDMDPARDLVDIMEYQRTLSNRIDRLRRIVSLPGVSPQPVTKTQAEEKSEQ